jgi:type IV secretion system protein TrbF
MHPFFRPKRPLSSAPLESPFQRAGQIWDERMGLTLAHARAWRRIALANLVLAAFLGAGWWRQAERALVEPFVVEVSRYGEPQKITPLRGRYEPTSAQTAHTLANWVRDVRSRSIDPIVVRANLMRAFDLTTPKASGFLSAWAKANDPFAQAGREAIHVEVLNVVPRSARTFDLQWREKRYVNGQLTANERWRALITVTIQPPRTETELMKNPLGIRIEDVSWSLDAA